MRPINFFAIFAICLALVLFSLQNTEPATIQLIEGVKVQAPICVEIIIAMGVGAVLAWLFSLWTRLQRLLISREEIRQKRQQDRRIQELEQNVERYKAEIEQQHQLPPSVDLETVAAPTAEVLAK